MRTEQDLHSALHAFAHRNAPDAAAARARLAAALPSLDTDDRAADVDSALRSGRWKQRGIGALAAAACIGGVAAGGAVISHQRSETAHRPTTSTTITNTTTTSPTTTSPTMTSPPPGSTAVPRPTATVSPRTGPSLAVPHPIGLPGTRHIAYFQGTGPKKIVLPQFVLPTDFQPTVAVTCRGASAIEVVDSTSTNGRGVSTRHRAGSQDCDTATSIAPASRWVMLRVSATAQWRMSFDLEPELDTNGTIMRSDQFGSFAGATSGRGTRTVDLSDQPDLASVTTVALRCSGAGVTVASPDHRIVGLSTGRCVAGFTYQWQINGQRLSAKKITVHADPGTTWQLLLG